LTVLQTTIAGSLPKPAWLAEPKKLWAPWLLEGALLDEGKRDEIEPFKFWLTLTPTSKIQRPTPERQKRVQELREKRRAEGKDKHHRKPIKRVSGVAVANLVEERTGIAPSRSATKRENVETLSQFEKWDIVRKATATA